jgi:hypothetical protein
MGLACLAQDQFVIGNQHGKFLLQLLEELCRAFDIGK